MSDTQEIQAQLTAACDRVADATGFPPETVRLVAASLGDATYDKAGNPISAGAEEVVRALLVRVDRDYRERVERTLEAFRITSSDDIGQIVFALVDQQLIAREEMDTPQDFAGIFDQTNLDECLKTIGIVRQRRRRRPLGWLSILCYVAGFGIAIGVSQDMLTSNAWVPIATGAVVGGIVFGSYRT